MQERVRTGDFALLKHPGAENPADILTKAVSAELINRHTATAGLSWGDGRPKSAPLLDGFTWKPGAAAPRSAASGRAGPFSAAPAAK